jgi:hypothetical protein
MRTDTINRNVPPLRPWVVYTLGGAFVVLLFVCYFQAELVLGWMESLIRALFMR